MKIRIKLMGQARAAIGRGSDEIDCADSASVAFALNALAEKHGDALRRILFDDRNKPHTSVMLFVNDEQVVALQSCVLNEGDELTIMPPISGG